MADFLREQYWARRQFAGGSGPSHAPASARSVDSPELWHELARELTNRVTNPYMFMDAQFNGRRPGTRPPSPTALNTRSAHARYEAYREKKKEQTIRGLQSNLNTCRQVARAEVVLEMQYGGSTNKEEAIQFVVSDPTTDLCSLFRYLLAEQAGFPDYAERYFVEAVVQYVPFQEEYDAAWGDHIPEDFREIAPRAYAEIFSPANDQAHSCE